MKPAASKLILVEGLTGSGKSILAHFLARQLRSQGISATWIHEAEIPHPILLDDDQDINEFMPRVLARWQQFLQRLDASNQISVVEACFFNNLIEELMIADLPTQEILDYAEKIYAVMRPIKPSLIYLSQGNVRDSLLKNFANRGDSFRDFVIRFVTGTPYAQSRKMEGLEGTLRFWEDFASLTDLAYARYPYPKMRPDWIDGQWHQRDQAILNFLGIPYTPELSCFPPEAASLAGSYRDEKNDRTYIVRRQNQTLTINLFLNVRSRLIYQSDNHFLVEGWHFEVIFDRSGIAGQTRLRIEGKDVDYLHLVGSTAIKQA
jgi:hypothetical protein